MNNLKIIVSMKKWIICYADKSGDTSKVWIAARTADDAVDYAKCAYWDIDEIIYCHEM